MKEYIKTKLKNVEMFVPSSSMFIPYSSSAIRSSLALYPSVDNTKYPQLTLIIRVDTSNILTDKTDWNTQGFIQVYDEKTYSKRIRIVIDNTNNMAPSTVTLKVFGGFIYSFISTPF